MYIKQNNKIAEQFDKHTTLGIHIIDTKWYSPTVSKLHCLKQPHSKPKFSSGINPLTAKLFNLNFHPLEAVSRWRDPQLQVSENYSAWQNGG